MTSGRDRQEGAATSRWRARLFGTRDRLGWWLLPMFLAVGLAGAVLAGSLAAVYAGQRVDRLTRETAGARADLAGAVDDVRQAAEEALAQIRDEVEAVREGLTTELPYDNASRVGILYLALDVDVPAPRRAPDPPSGTGPDEEEAAPAQPPPDPPIQVRRRASGFVVARDGDEAFVVTNFALVADPRRPDTPLDVAVNVHSATGRTTGRLHSWDADKDLVLLRAALGDVQPLPWRPAELDLAGGERIVAIGLTPTLEPVRIGGTVAAADGTVLVTDVPALDLLAGGPLVDAEGRVVGIGSLTYAPYGQDPVAVPVRRLCEELLRRCPA